jgi:alkylation response protein AidB-like acyl-CoA dehydrogenase
MIRSASPTTSKPSLRLGWVFSDDDLAFEAAEAPAHEGEQMADSKRGARVAGVDINGTKMWVTNGMRAAIVALMAKTPDGRVTCFMVEKEPGETFEGIACSRKIEKLGYRGLETVEMVYTDHRVPGENMLGDESGMGRGLNAALSALELGRINIAARAVGVARAAFEGSVEYAQHRHTFGKPIYEHQAIQFKLADMATKIEAARLRCHSAANKFDQGIRADMAKLFLLRGWRRGRARGHADSRRQRLYQRLSDRAVLPGRAADDHRRRHQRDPKARDRSPAAGQVSDRLTTVP